MLGTCIWDIVERLPRLVQPYYLLLLFHIGPNDTARDDLESIKCDYVALGAIVKNLGAQVVFSLILLVKGKGLRRTR